MGDKLEARDIRPCMACGNGLAHAGGMMVWRVTVEPFVLNHTEIQRRSGLESMLGGAIGLANVFDPGYAIAEAPAEATSGLLCIKCATTLPVAIVAEDAP